MLDVLSAGVLGSLHGDDIFFFAYETFHEEPIDVVAALVFVALDEVPTQNKVFGNVVHTVALQAHGHVVPGHATKVGFADFVALPVFYALEVHDPVVVEVLSWENVAPQACWVDIGQWVLVCVPSSEA